MGGLSVAKKCFVFCSLVFWHCSFTPLVFDGSIFGAENRKPKNGTILIDEMLQLKESCSSYDEKMEELQSYVDMVKCILQSFEPLALPV